MATAAKKAAPKSPAKSNVSASKKQKKTTPEAAPAVQKRVIEPVPLRGPVTAPAEGAEVGYSDGQTEHKATVVLVHQDLRIDATVQGEAPFTVSAVPHWSQNPEGPHWFHFD